MPSKSKQGVYNPQANNTQNHKALDYIIHELINASIEVVPCWYTASPMGQRIS